MQKFKTVMFQKLCSKWQHNLTKSIAGKKAIFEIMSTTPNCYPTNLYSEAFGIYNMVVPITASDNVGWVWGLTLDCNSSLIAKHFSTVK